MDSKWVEQESRKKKGPDSSVKERGERAERESGVIEGAEDNVNE